MQQINDSQFPIGSYSHSYGFETYVQEGKINNEKETMEYLVNYLSGSFLYSDLFSVFLAFEASRCRDIKKIREICLKLRALKSQKEIREASEKLGSRLIKTINEMDVSFDLNFLNEVIDFLEMDGILLHHSVAYGIICYLAGLELDMVLAGFSFSIATTITSNAVKTIPMSQMSGQRILFAIKDLIGDLVKGVKELEQADFGLSFPGMEISSMRHEHLYSRLYMS